MEYKKERIVGYEEYGVDTNGVVYSKKDRPLKYSLNHGGYRMVTFITNKIRKTFPIHRLVALQFIKNEDDWKTVVNHKDGDKQNNNVENLEWVTHRENALHSCYVLGKNIGGNHVNSKRIIGINKYGNDSIKFDSLSDAARYVCKLSGVDFDKTKCGIWRSVSGHRKSYHGYIWRYE